jgi:hypothetical protein
LSKGADFFGLGGLKFPHFYPILIVILAELLFDDQDEHHQIYQEQQRLVSTIFPLKKQPIQNTHFEINLTLGFGNFRFIFAISVDSLTLLDI